MLHACVRRFDVTDTVGKFLETKQGLSYFFKPVALIILGLSRLNTDMRARLRIAIHL